MLANDALRYGSEEGDKSHWNAECRLCVRCTNVRALGAGVVVCLLVWFHRRLAMLFTIDEEADRASCFVDDPAADIIIFRSKMAGVTLLTG